MDLSVLNRVLAEVECNLLRHSLTMEAYESSEAVAVRLRKELAAFAEKLGVKAVLSWVDWIPADPDEEDDVSGDLVELTIPGPIEDRKVASEVDRAFFKIFGPDSKITTMVGRGDDPSWTSGDMFVEGGLRKNGDAFMKAAKKAVEAYAKIAGVKAEGVDEARAYEGMIAAEKGKWVLSAKNGKFYIETKGRGMREVSAGDAVKAYDRAGERLVSKEDAFPSWVQEGSGNVAKTIAAQLGGIGSLRMMTGASEFLDAGNGLHFRFKGSRKMNHVQITLLASDTYKVVFGKKGSGGQYKEVREFDGVHADQLKEIFERETGLYLKLV